jgi:hypothetical protein
MFKGFDDSSEEDWEWKSNSSGLSHSFTLLDDLASTLAKALRFRGPYLPSDCHSQFDVYIFAVEM